MMWVDLAESPYGVQWSPYGIRGGQTRPLTVDNIRQTLAEAKKAQDGSIIAFFDRKGKGRVKYMMQQHTYEEARSVLNKNRVVDKIITAFKVLNMSAGVLRVCGASGLWTMQVFIV